MSRVFRRGELKQAITVVLADLGDAHGYAIMSELESRIGGGWKPSPGAIYPALLALVETGYLRMFEQDEVRMYALTETGHRAVEASDWRNRWPSLSARAAAAEDRVAIGSLLDDFASASALRRRLANPAQRQEITEILAQAHTQIEETIQEGEDNG
jgi:DNA-binding PadR family transcriptional regulator